MRRYPKTRADRGQPRRLPPEVAEVLLSLKTEQPALSVSALIKAAQERGVDHPLAPSTVHRLLSREGLLDKRPGDPAATDRRCFAYRTIREEITRLVCEAKQLPVLVIDEAQHLRNDVLEDLRLLCNFAMDSENRLCLLLVGLTELRRRLAMACHESLAQRLVVRHHLGVLDREELHAYLVHRLRLAGCEHPLFEPCAVEALSQSTRGLPRRINRTAHYALTAAAANGARTVTAEHVEHAIAELRL